VTVDVVFFTWNRLAFTMLAYQTLMANTDWGRVRRLIVIDDGSTDGTLEWLRKNLDPPAGVTVDLWELRGAGPVGNMVRYLQRGPADVFAKIDNDIAVPPGWLERMLDVLADHASLELLGMELLRVPLRPTVAAP
jgi:glycosyltransferase involved in cell wall biosynthesis